MSAHKINFGTEKMSYLHKHKSQICVCVSQTQKEFWDRSIYFYFFGVIRIPKLALEISRHIAASVKEILKPEAFASSCLCPPS